MKSFGLKNYGQCREEIELMQRLARSASFCDDRAADLDFLMSFEDEVDPATQAADLVVSSLTIPRRGQVRDKIV